MRWNNKKFSGSEPVEQWYSEIDNYDFVTGKKKDDSGRAIGHFTAMIWDDVKKVGFGFACEDIKMM